MLLQVDHFQCLPKNRIEGESDELFPPEFYERTSVSEISTKRLSKDLQPRSSAQGTGVKYITSAAKIIGFSWTSISRGYF